MDLKSKIYVAGNTGLVGSAIERNLISRGYTNLIFTSRKTHDLADEFVVKTFFESEKPDVVFLAAAMVGGIVANTTYRADFIYENLRIQNNIIHQSYKNNVKKLIFLGSSCIYPKNCPQPIREDYLLRSELEYTNEPYAIAKIAGIKMIESYNLQYGTNFLALMPTNLYGYRDNFDLEKSHVLPAMIRKMHLAKALWDNKFDLIKNDLNKMPVEGVSGNSSNEDIISILSMFGITSSSVELWGSGKPRREFMHADDLADACIYIAENVNFSDILKNEFNVLNPTFPFKDKEIRNTHINIGTGKDISISELAFLIKDQVVLYKGDINWNIDKPDGTFQKLLDVNKLHKLGWKEKINFIEGIKSVYEDYKLYV